MKWAAFICLALGAILASDASAQLVPPAAVDTTLESPELIEEDLRAVNYVYVGKQSAFAINATDCLAIGRDKSTKYFGYKLKYEKKEGGYWIYSSDTEDLRFKFEIKPASGSAFDVRISQNGGMSYVRWELTTRGTNIGDAP